MKALILILLLSTILWAKPTQLLLLKPSIQGLNHQEVNTLYKSMQMVFNQQEFFDVLSSDEVLYGYQKLGFMRPPHCFDDLCFLNAGQDLKQDLVIGVFGYKTGNRMTLDVRLYGVKEKSILWKQSFEFIINNPQDHIQAFQSIAQELLGYEKTRTDQYTKIKTDYVKPYTWSMISGAALVGWMVYEFGPWSPRANTDSKFESDNLQSLNLPYSGMRGFYASRPLGARFRAMGGAGVSLVRGALSPMWNPAGIANSTGQEFQFSREVLPGEVPKQYLGYSAPLIRNLYHSQALQYEGDGLAKEMVYYSTYATDLSLFSTYFNRVQAGVNFKGYLIEVGAECVGQDCSRGTGYGAGLDVGLQWSINSTIQFGAVLKDPVSFIQYENDYTGSRYSENLAPLFIAGVAYQFSPTFNASLDLQKSLYADQKDRISIGMEKKVFDLLWLRSGIYQISDYDEFRVWTLGFGIEESQQGYVYSINYHFEYANENAILFQGQQSFDFGLHF